MKFRKLHKWTLDESLEGLIFLAQRLDELLFDFTLDSYKPSALNAPFLCIEILDIIKDIENDNIEAANLSHLLDELSWSISNDKIAKSLLDVSMDQYILSGEEPLSQKKLRIEVLGKTLDERRYLSACFFFLKKSVTEKKKKDIDFGARVLITTLINMGISKTFLRQKIHEFFYHGDDEVIDSVDDLDHFFEAIHPIHHSFDVYFLVSEDVKVVEKSIRSFSIKILEKLPEEIVPFAMANSLVPNGSEVYVKIDDIQTFDAYSARKMAERRIDMLKDLLTLFSHKNDLRWRPNTLIVQCCNDLPKIIGTPRNAMEKSNDMHATRASKRLNWMLSNMSLEYDAGSFEKFNRIVDLHGICVSNEVPENQLLNLWISLETLVPSHGRKNKIVNIIDSLDPILRMTYVTRLMDQALADLLMWNQRVIGQILRRVPDANHTKAAMRLLQLLALDSNIDLRNELYGRLKDFHLLRFRLFSLAESLKTPRTVKDMLDNHSKKVAWQLRRIYRTRNLLVHSGRTPTYLSTLIENGHDYLDLALNQIMERTCGEYQVSTMEQAFELEKLLLKRFNENLNRTEIFDANSVKYLYLDTAQFKFF
jgi:hypothetical protein